MDKREFWEILTDAEKDFFKELSSTFGCRFIKAKALCKTGNGRDEHGASPAKIQKDGPGPY